MSERMKSNSPLNCWPAPLVDNSVRPSVQPGEVARPFQIAVTAAVSKFFSCFEAIAAVQLEKPAQYAPVDPPITFSKNGWAVTAPRFGLEQTAAVPHISV